jgi:hypothetical protein
VGPSVYSYYLELPLKNIKIMNKNIAILTVVICILISAGENLYAQNKTGGEDAKLQMIPPVPVEYEASPAYPFGRLNPKAPPETGELEFLIGEFDCEDRIYSPQNKKWFRMDVVRRAEYILNGYAIQDKNRTPILNSTNIRAYDTKTRQWHITYFRTPYSSAVWKGGKEGENMVFLQERGKSISRLTFFDIGKDSYSWKAENVADGKAVMNWVFTCRRRR